MIEPTDEMVAAFLAAWDRENRVINESVGEYVEVGARDRAGIVAVLAIVERDYRVHDRRECRADGPDGRWCERQPGHDELHGNIRAGGLVRW